MIRHSHSKAIAAASVLSVSMMAALPTYAGTVTSDGADLVLQTRGGLKLGTADKKYSVQLGGRIQYDYNQAENDSLSPGTEDDFDVRRARLYVKGTIQDWSFKSQFNVDSGGAEDLYVRYNGFGKQAKVTLGKQKMPFGLEELTSSKDISMLERSALTEAYAIGRAEGLQVHGEQGNMTYAVAAYDIGNAADGTDDFGAAARVTFAPVKTDESVFHVGAAFKDIEDGKSVYALEAAAVFGALHGQVEFFDADNGTGNADTDGYYVQVGYVVTGEQRPYKGGVFKKIKPSGTNGAVEVVARYEDGEGDFGDIELGSNDATAWGLGVNWYVTNAVRLGLNYTDGERESDDVGGEEYRARLQIAF
ncbi:MAG: ATPase [Gammaproteobacteria bacterium]|nr:ATPase [Gammaproteobacteria bacterium]NND38803.1 ATPase [Pseudomonadales bacterium]NNM11206.1 ATPase [Pseudomonadales bacterium]RZV49895.1 MAG: ATPase [Pseudomonadales bacterium]